MTVRDELAVGLWDPGDESVVPQIMEGLVAVGVPERFGIGWFYWKFRDGPWGPAVVAYARDRSDGRIAGVTAFGMWRLLHDGAPVLAGISFATFVHPEFQKRGLFTELTRLAQEEALRRGARVLFNFPNQSSRHGFLRLGWQDMHGIETWVKPVRLVRVLSRVVTGPRSLKAVVADPPDAAIHGAVPPFDDFSSLIEARTSWAGLWAGERTPSMLRWRFFGHPRYRYLHVEGDGVTALVRTASRGSLREAQIMDVFFPPERPAAAIRRLFRTIAERCEADTLAVMVTRGHPLRPILKTSGFLPVPNRVNFFTYPLVKDCPPVGDQVNWALSFSEIHMM